ncbi:MAG: xanthine dehydrogenase family protein subunit M, partial [Candidatus Wallbacteria bacterium]|nr:xanthine dehydrogenase family protein subunit M [Candidatus Wallbacteria bacterium]
VKVKDRAAFAFALASAAAAVVVKRGVIRGARLALGAVAGVPWRAHLAEERLLGRRPSTTLFEEAAEAELAAARPLAGNDYKIPMAKGALVEALERATGTPDG